MSNRAVDPATIGAWAAASKSIASAYSGIRQLPAGAGSNAPVTVRLSAYRHFSKSSFALVPELYLIRSLVHGSGLTNPHYRFKAENRMPLLMDKLADNLDSLVGLQLVAPEEPWRLAYSIAQLMAELLGTMTERTDRFDQVLAAIGVQHTAYIRAVRRDLGFVEGRRAKAWRWTRRRVLRRSDAPLAIAPTEDLIKAAVTESGSSDSGPPTPQVAGPQPSWRRAVRALRGVADTKNRVSASQSSGRTGGERMALE
jgi:hypothetical protein